MVRLEEAARMILTDSGGIQKEAYWLEVPCVTLREETEWVETVETGWNKLAGTRIKDILKGIQSYKLPDLHPPLYGDESVAERTVYILVVGTSNGVSYT
jgi:UDP-GlcNAc3NAcA epimerase